MKLTVTIEISTSNKKFHIQMDSRQRIQTTLRVLGEVNAGFVPYADCREVRIKDTGRRISTEDTYSEAGIYTGDILVLGEESEEEATEQAEKEIEEYEDVQIDKRKKSELTAADYFDYERLVYKNIHFIPCTYTEEGEYIHFAYQCTGLTPLTEISKEDRCAQYQFLINFTRLLELFQQFSIRALPENIYYDENYLPYVYMSIGMTIITTIFSIRKFRTDKREIREHNTTRQEIYEKYLLKMQKKINKAQEFEREAYGYQYPDIEQIEDMVEKESSRLYERTALEDDFMVVNLGHYTGKSQVTVKYAKDKLEIEKDPLVQYAKDIVKTRRNIAKIPVPVDLKKAHLGIVGDRENQKEQLKSIFAQLTFFQSYHDLQIIFIHNESEREEFNYLRWYPHLKIQAINMTGEICTEQVRDQILGSIQQILKDRKQKLEEEKKETIFVPYLLFVIAEPKLVVNHAIMEYLQKDQAELGYGIIYTTDQKANLPENIGTVCILDNSEDARLLLQEKERVDLRFQWIHTNQKNLEFMARRLSAIVHEQGVSSKIPESITFFEMYQIEHPQELKAEQRWKKNESHKSLAVPLGVRAEEDYVELNLHEKAHGPHGLVAGTTGSGKSEIIQSYILSLAVNFHPHEVGFLLIDYKGGGMANLFAELPHLLGTITNLDKAESMRAMASIKSELARRQQMFSDNNVNHINGYNKLFKLGQVKEPLPHLFMISDEFAELKKEQPEFMKELVSTARIGRSLGIHLILATQKPSGVVDDQIWTNSKFRLCLKVQNAGDSKEMLKTPDAANITQAGRSYLQVGNNEIYELFQSAWSGATYGAEQTQEEKEDDRVYLVNDLGQGELLNQDLSGPKESNQIKATQLDVVVDYLSEVYKKEHAVAVKKPWLPSLPAPMESPYTKEIRDSSACSRAEYRAAIGMIDIPEEQLQEEYIVDFMKNGHVIYMASSGYGKTVFLTNLALSMAMKNSVKNLNMYILDLGNSAMIPMKSLPHVADYMGLDDGEKIGKFQKRILEEIADRKRKLARVMAQNFYVYNESQEEKLKAIIILVDNYDAVKELGDSLEAFLQKVSRDGAGLGIYLAVTMTRMNVMRSSTMNNFKVRIAGFNFETSANRSFVGRSDHDLPEDKKGRALVKRDSVNVMQLYTPVSCDTELAYSENLKELVQRIAQASTEEAAIGIPVLPEELFYEMLQQYPGYVKENTRLPIGIDTEELQVQYIDLKQGPGLIIGSGGMGRTNTIKNLMKAAAGYVIYLFDAKNSNLRMYAEQENVHYAATQEDIEAMLLDIKKQIQQRKEAFEDHKTEFLNVKEYG